MGFTWLLLKVPPAEFCMLPLYPTSLHTFCLVMPPQPFRFHHSNNTVPSVMLCFVMGKTVPNISKDRTSTSIYRVKVFQEAPLSLHDHEDLPNDTT